MNEAYVDSSALIAVSFGEPSNAAVLQWLRRFSILRSSHLLEAELRAAYARESMSFDPFLLDGIRWIAPERPLSAEMTTILQVGYLRGADLWHVAAALYYARDPREMTFLTLDAQQRAVAATLGFQT